MSLDITSYILAKNYTDKQILESNNLKVKIVNELPETGVVNTIYLVRDENGDNDNLYNEYMYVGGNFELIGAVSVDVDVTDIQINGSSIVENGVANIPIATQNGTYGLVKIGPTTYGVIIDSTGNVTLQNATNSNIDNRINSACPITPTNLDYAVKAAMCDGEGEDWAESEKLAARERINAISIDDIPNAGLSGNYGLVKFGSSDLGIGVSNNTGNAFVYAAGQNEINSRQNNYRPITPNNLDYAVKAAMTDDNGAAWSDTEKLAARERIGAITIDDISRATDGGDFGIVKYNSPYGVAPTISGDLQVRKSTNAEIDARAQQFKPIVPNNLDYAVKVAMCDGKGAAWTDAEKIAARERISAITIDDIPIAKQGGMSAPGLIKLGTGDTGISVSSASGNACVLCASNANIDARLTQFKPIVPTNFDYAVKCAMTDGIGEAWTENEKKASRERMGIPTIVSLTRAEYDNMTEYEEDVVYLVGD